jgi:hypothetical protein
MGITQWTSYKKCFDFQVKISHFRVLQLPVTANIVPSSLILSTLKMVETCSSKTSAIIRATRYHIPEDDIVPSNRRGNLIAYK